MKKFVINRCYGGFGLSDVAMKRYAELKGVQEPIYPWDIERDDPALVAVVEEFGAAANDDFAKLKIVEIPDDEEFKITEYYGMEFKIT